MKSETFDARQFRDALGAFVTGVTVVTTVDADGKPHGLTANSFSSVSLDPPLVLWSQSLKAPSHPIFSEAAHFCVSILADDQVDISNRFARPGNKFDGVPTRQGIAGIPLIEGSAATLECTKVTSYPGGDHTVFIGRVRSIERSDRRPLAFGGGKYLVAHRHDASRAIAAAASSNIAKLQAVRAGMQVIAELSERLDETFGLGVWGNHGPTIVRWEESSQPVSDNLQTGLVLPVFKSSTGLCFAAHLPADRTMLAIEQEFAAEQLPPEAAVATMSEMRATLESVRIAGMAKLTNTSDFAGIYGREINAVSAPVRAANGDVVLVLTAIGDVDRMPLDEDGKVVPALRKAALHLSERLGHAAPKG
ncbi:p-hydroxyphenylacetate 3-hydroxylase, reductase component [Variovorax sp. PBL-H6]|uniref:flavin reductase n=1 Tax=Variovorax sp. PBL-H6 TaxID=434009 RepID=UPI0013165F70|nr:flavin reductase [Variovorax sp. PBL-H6]VTU15098.1 p-hydroxyphenylacetate 3-hydroxylase, reductase component [Variovorax sp. PBL-H6]